MERIVYENSFNSKITFQEEFPYFLEELDGIHEKSSELYGVSSAFGIGEFYVGENVAKRNINITGYFKDHFRERTIFLNNIFRNNDEGTLFYYDDDFSVKIKCRVEKVEIEKSGAIRRFFISLICFNPYFEETEEHLISLASWEGGIEFPLEISEDGLEFGTKNHNVAAIIENSTSIETGLKVVLTVTGTVKKPSIKNIVNQEILTLDYDLIIGDEVIITTGLNNKNIILKRNNEEININNYLLFGTKFLQLKPGINNIKILAEEGIEYLSTSISYSLLYEAV